MVTWGHPCCFERARRRAGTADENRAWFAVTVDLCREEWLILHKIEYTEEMRCEVHKAKRPNCCQMMWLRTFAGRSGSSSRTSSAPRVCGAALEPSIRAKVVFATNACHRGPVPAGVARPTQDRVYGGDAERCWIHCCIKTIQAVTADLCLEECLILRQIGCTEEMRRNAAETEAGRRIRALV